MAPSFTKLFKRKKDDSKTQSVDASGSSFVGGNGWLAFKEALKVLKDVSSGPLAPVKIALGPVLACMEHAEKVTGTHDEFQQLATKIDGFTDIFLCYKDRPDLSSTMRGHLDQVSKEIEDIGATLSAKTGRPLAKRTLYAFKDVNEVKDLVDKLSHSLQRFKMYGDLEVQIGVSALTTGVNTLTTGFNALATDNALNKLEYVPTAGIDALDEDGCMDGTRMELMENLRKWCIDPAEPPIFWLDGMAGTGKSAISRSLSRFLREHGLLGGSFFCRRGQVSRSDVKRILPTLAWFLARRDSQYRESLIQSLQNDPDLTDYSIERQVKLLLEEPLRKQYESNRPSLVLVIDALDECSEGERVKLLLDELLSLPSGLPIKFFLTSRPERHIRTQFESPHAKIHRIVRLHDIEQDIVDKDISLYLQAQLQRIRTSSKEDFPHEWPTRRDIERLTTLAGKLFICAFTAVKYIEGHDPIERLEKLTGITGTGTVSQKFYKHLDGIYSLVLAVAMDPEELDESEILKIKELVGTVLAIREPLCVSGLAGLLDISPSKVRSNLDRLHAVISVPPGNEEGAVSTFHASFGDYLTTSGRASESMLLSLGVSHRDLAHGCLQTMNKELKFNVTDCKTSLLPNSDQPHASISSLLKYSCVYWASHVLAATEIQSVLKMIETVLFRKFLYWLEVLSVMDASKMASISLLRILTAESMTDKMSSNLVQFFEDASEFVTTFQDAISLSAPHIYVSALPLVREDSMVSTKFSSMFQRTAKFKLSGIEQRQKSILNLRGHTAAVSSVKFSPDGTRIVSGSGDKTIRVWDARTGEELMDPFSGHISHVTSVGFSPDGTRIVSGSYDKTIRVWDARTGKELMDPLNGHSNTVNSVGFSPDGTRIVSGSDDRTIRVWDARTGKELMDPLNGHTSFVASVGFSPDGTRIVSGWDDKTIRVWDTRTGEELMKLNGHTSNVNSVAFSLDGTRIVSGSGDKTIRMWDAKTGEELMKLNGHISSVISVSFSPDGTRIVSGSHDDTIGVWDARTGEELMDPLIGHSEGVNSVCFSPDGTRIVSGSHGNTIGVWDARTDEGLMDPLNGHTSFVASLGFSPDGTRIVSGSGDKTIRVWDTRTGEELMKLNGHTSNVNSVGFSPDGICVVSGSSDKTIRMWDAKTGEELMNPFSGHISHVTSVGFSPDGTRIVSGSYDDTIRVWDAKTGGELMKLKGHTSGVRSVSFSPDGICIVSGSSDNTIRVWDARTGDELMDPLTGHNSFVNSVGFSPNGARIVSGSGNKTIRVWDARTGEASMNLYGHTEEVNSVSFSPDGTRIFSGSNDNTIRIWDAKTGEELMKLNGHTSRVTSVAFSQDGTCIASGSSDRTIRIWDVQSFVGHQVTRSTPLSSHALHACHVSISPSDGWIRDLAGQLILKVSPEYVLGLVLPPCHNVIGPHRVFVDSRQFVYGTEWTLVYTP